MRKEEEGSDSRDQDGVKSQLTKSHVKNEFTNVLISASSQTDSRIIINKELGQSELTLEWLGESKILNH